MVLAEDILSLGLLKGEPSSPASRYRFQYSGLLVDVDFAPHIRRDPSCGLYFCTSPCFGAMLVEGTLHGGVPREGDYLSAAIHAFEELEIRGITEPQRLEPSQVKVLELGGLIKSFLGNINSDEYYP